MKKSFKSNLAFAGLSLFFSVAANAQQWNTIGNTLTGTLPASPTEFYGSLNGADLIFKTANAEKIRITNSGFLGINQSAPLYMLDVKAPAITSAGENLLNLTVFDASTDYMRVVNGTSGNGSFVPVLVGNKSTSGTSASGLYLIGSLSAANDNVSTGEAVINFNARRDFSLGGGTAIVNRPLFSWTNYTTKYMVMLSNGNLGLGNTNPTFARLEVQNAAVNNTPDAIPGFSILKNTGTAARRLFMVPHLYGWGYNQLSRDGDFGMFWTDGGASGGQNSTGGLVIAPWAGSSAGIRITKDGNVGIGTALTNNPNNYKLAVNGTIGAKELKIEISSTTWADFVFEKEYKLMPLAEVEKYVNKNKHLPAIPSAKDVEDSNGINIGEMQTKLLQKVEELTLYIIQIEKDKEALIKRVEVLERK